MAGRRVVSILTLLCALSLGVGVGAQDGAEQGFYRADVDANGTVDLTDTFAILDYFFFDADPVIDCEKAFDVNDDGLTGVADVVAVLEFQFTGGAAPADPFGDCGVDPTADDLTCNEHSECGEVIPFSPAQTAHVLRRIAYGQTPDLYDYVEEIGLLAYIDEQLDPTAIDESGNTALNNQLDDLDPDADLTDFYRLQIVRNLHSERQLQEVLTDFWENHFNTQYSTVLFGFFSGVRTEDPVPVPVYDFFEAREVTVSLEHKENQAFRDNGLGNFYDLLYSSATSPTMLIYLNNIQNISGNPNENYAREILELHTMGVDNGYNQTDIEELARVFTGWGVCLVVEGEELDPEAECMPIVADPEAEGLKWAFHFYPDRHDDGIKVIFEDTPYEITLGDNESGVDEGFAFIEHLVDLSQTAEYISEKLIQKLVSDEVPPALLASCLAEWDESEGDMTAVVETILTSDEFLVDEEYRLNKVKTPMEFLCSTVRAFEGVTNSAQTEILAGLTSMEHLPLNWPTPDGFPEKGDDQLGSAKVLERIRFSQYIYETFDGVTYNQVKNIMDDHDVSLNDVEEVVKFWMDRLIPDAYSEVDQGLAEQFLSTDDDGDAQALNSASTSAYRLRVQKFLAFLAAWPQNLKQ